MSKETPVLLRHDLADVPPLMRGHYAFLRHYKTNEAQQNVAVLGMDLWLGKYGMGLTEVEAKPEWFRPMTPVEDARMLYLARIRSESSEFRAFGEAWGRTGALLRSLVPSSYPSETNPLWPSHSADAVARSLGLQLTPRARAQLSRLWMELVQAHEALRHIHTVALEES